MKGIYTQIAQAKKVLVIGDGNFSFTKSLVELGFDASKLISTDFSACYSLYDDVEKLRKKGCSIHFDVDCTRLSEFCALSYEKVDCIVFNFPHVGGKMKIHLNRKLLKDFFLNAVNYLSDQGKIFVTLCSGQGGTPADTKQVRQESDSWQVVRMAAFAGLVLMDHMPFVAEDYPTYHPTGYRSQTKNFNTEGAITYVFCKDNIEEKFPLVPICSEEPHLSSIKYSLLRELHCSLPDWGYLVHKFSDNLFRAPDSVINHLLGLLINAFGCTSVYNANDALLLSDHVDLCRKWPVLFGNELYCLRTDLSVLLDSVFVNSCGGIQSHLLSTNILFSGCCFHNCKINALDFILSHDVAVISRENPIQQLIHLFPVQITAKGLASSSNHSIHIEGKEIGYVRRRNGHYSTLLQLDLLALKLFNLSSIQQLWNCFIVNNKTTEKSLFPPMYTHDISFWCPQQINDSLVMNIVRSILADWVAEVNIIDTYKKEQETSYCMRIKYQSYFGALSSDDVRNFHFKILKENLEQFGLIIR